MSHQKIETNVGWMAILIAVAISFGGLAEIIPLMYQAETVQPLPGVKPYGPLELAGRDIYVREGCYNCHSQMVRTLRHETERYGHYSLAGESVYDRPFQWGSKRTGPDLARSPPTCAPSSAWATRIPTRRSTAPPPWSPASPSWTRWSPISRASARTHPRAEP